MSNAPPRCSRRDPAGRIAAAAQTTAATPPPAATFNVTVVATPLPGERVPIGVIRRAGADRHGPRHRAERRARSVGVSRPADERRLPQRGPEQSVPGRRELSRLHRVAAARHAAGPLGLHGRRPPQSAVRRSRELGSDPAPGDRDRDADAGIESAVRPEHARRRDRAADEDRTRAAAARRCRPPTAATSRRALDFEHGGHTATAAFHWYLAGSVFGEDGWRDDSPSDVRQVFGKLGWRRDAARRRAVGGARRHVADRQRPAGRPAPRPRLRQRLHQAGHDRQPVDARQRAPRAIASNSAHVRRNRAPTTATSGPRRSTATSTRTRSIRRSISRAPRSAPRSRPPATATSRRAG